MKPFLTLIALLNLVLLPYFGKTQEESYHAWWNDRHPGGLYESTDNQKMPLIGVEGNAFVNPQGQVVQFKGINIADPDKLANQGQWNKSYFEAVKAWGVTLVRIPVHPVAWRERSPEKYLQLLDQAVEWCTELELYIIIDWHSIGNLKTEMFQDPMYITSFSETAMFWRTIAQRYSQNNTIAFYELFNEPTTYRNQLGTISWSTWRQMMEEIIDICRSFDKNTIPLVAGFDWAYDLTPLRLEPIGRPGIGYVTHPYPHKRSQPWVPKWDEAFGFAADEYPIMATEIGFVLGEGGMKDNGEYGKEIIEYLNSKGISWLWWVFDPEWHPSLIKDWESLTPTEFGLFCKSTY